MCALGSVQCRLIRSVGLCSVLRSVDCAEASVAARLRCTGDGVKEFSRVSVEREREGREREREEREGERERERGRERERERGREGKRETLEKEWEK